MAYQSLDENGVVKQATNALLEVALPTDAPPDIRKVGSGQQLAQARADAGLSIEALAARLRLSTAQVLALDAERWEQLPDLAFVRGALRAYGKQIDVNVTPLIEHVGGFAEPTVLEPTSAIEPVAKAAGAAGGFRPNSAPLIERLTQHRWSVIAAGCLVFLGLLLLLGGGLGGEQTTVRVQAVPIPGVSPPVVGGNTQLRPAMGSIESQSVPAPARDATPSIGTGGSIIRFAPDPVTIQGASQVTPERQLAGGPSDETRAVDDGRVRVAGAVTVFPVQMPDSEPVHIHFSKRAWVDISHKDGVKLLSGIQNANQSFKLDGTPPMRVEIGNPTGVAIEFRGQLVDLKSKTNDKGVASFTLN